MKYIATGLANSYRGACIRIANDGPDIIDLAMSLWSNIAMPSILFGCETIPFTHQAVDEISRQQSSVGKFNLGLPSCAPNISSSVILGLKPFKELLYSAQLKYYVRLSKQPNDRWSKDAFLDNLCGEWPSPYIKMLGEIKQEIGMFKWPVSYRHVDIVLSHHFLEETNSAVRRLNLPALVPLAKRQRMSHVNETVESKVCVGVCIQYCIIVHILPLIVHLLNLSMILQFFRQFCSSFLLQLSMSFPRFSSLSPVGLVAYQYFTLLGIHSVLMDPCLYLLWITL